MKKTGVVRYVALFLLIAGFLSIPIAKAQVESKPIINATLTGTVIDAISRNPIEGVTVQLEAVTHSAITDRKGQFQFVTGQQFPVTLILTYVGYSRKVEVVQQSPVVIALNQEAEGLEEVVVIGYGTSRRKDVTEAITSIKASEFNKGVVTNVDQLFAGKAPGVQVVQSSGEPGGGISVRIRGVS